MRYKTEAERQAFIADLIAYSIAAFIAGVALAIFVVMTDYRPTFSPPCPRHESGHYTTTHPKRCAQGEDDGR